MCIFKNIRTNCDVCEDVSSVKFKWSDFPEIVIMPGESASMDVLVTKFILSFRGETESSYSLAVRTVDLVRALVECDNWSNADTLIKNVKTVYKRLEEELPHYHVTHNVIKYVDNYKM